MQLNAYVQGVNIFIKLQVCISCKQRLFIFLIYYGHQPHSQLRSQKSI